MHSLVNSHDHLLDAQQAQALLVSYGYGVVSRHGHLHATRNGQEWHVCLITDLGVMNAMQFLTCLQEALTSSLSEDQILLFSSRSNRF